MPADDLTSRLVVLGLQADQVHHTVGHLGRVHANRRPGDSWESAQSDNGS